MLEATISTPSLSRRSDRLELPQIVRITLSNRIQNADVPSRGAELRVNLEEMSSQSAGMDRCRRARQHREQDPSAARLRICKIIVWLPIVLGIVGFGRITGYSYLTR
jgi:hypothetical protein